MASTGAAMFAGTALGLTRASAQSQPSAATVASWVQTFYDQTRTMSARFVQTYHNRVYDQRTESRGQVRFRKPGMMRFDYDQPNGKIIVSDGNELVAYEPPGEGQQRGQYYTQPMTDAQLPAALSFLTGTGRLDQDFRFRRLDNVLFDGGQVLELRSRRPTPHYSRILLFVDASPARRGIVHRVLIIDSSNNRNQFDFQQQQLNRSIPESVFRWRPPANARRITP
jgi:outer membrane lipoprotein carrier protein